MKKLSLIIFFILFPFILYCQSTVSKAQARYIFKLTQLFEWPNISESEPFTISVIGNTDVFEELIYSFRDKKLFDRPIRFVQFGTYEDIKPCHILFIPFSETKNMKFILSKLEGENTLIFTEKNGALEEGSAINFLLIANKLKFEIKLANIKKYGLKPDEKLLKMAFNKS